LASSNIIKNIDVYYGVKVSIKSQWSFYVCVQPCFYCGRFDCPENISLEKSPEKKSIETILIFVFEMILNEDSIK